jgi:hypothetical protein
MNLNDESVIRQDPSPDRVTVGVSASYGAEAVMPTATVICETGAPSCAAPYRAAMTSSTNRPEGDVPTDAQIAEYRAKYGPPVPPTDLGEPEDPESFRALAVELRGESG